MEIKDYTFTFKKEEFENEEFKKLVASMIADEVITRFKREFHFQDIMDRVVDNITNNTIRKLVKLEAEEQFTKLKVKERVAENAERITQEVLERMRW